ncbi:MAG TPA: glycosyl transferase family 1 [Planctomycetaceae bacterium]|nr:glycosyl transferase family 1 [Planctomycetaceae bacterium]
MRVALVIPSLDRGGAEKQLCLLATGLKQQGIDPVVIVLTRDGPMRSVLDAAGVSVRVIGKRFRADPTAYYRLRRAIGQAAPDVVHTWLFAANAYGRWAARAVKVPVVLASERCVDLWKTPTQFAIDRYLAARASGITTNSVGVRDFYVSHGINADRFTIIPNGIPPRQAQEISRDEAFKRLQVDPSRRLILAVGRLWPQKRYRDLIWSAELLASMRQDTTLVIIGDGPQSGELLRHRDNVSHPNHVRFAGQRDDVLSLLPHADIYWIGSEYEGQSNSLIEAMQAGVAVVASDIPGNRDLVENGRSGLLVTVGDRADFARKTQTLLEDRDLASRLGEVAKQKIKEDFSVEAMVQSHATLYRRLFNEVALGNSRR